MILEMDSETYSNHMVFENGKKVIYVVVLREIYGILVVLLLFYKGFCRDLERIGFELYTYDPCVSNRIKVGKQNTVRFHVDNFMTTHLNPNINDKFKEWMDQKYGKHFEVTINIDKIHEYCGITYYF